MFESKAGILWVAGLGFFAFAFVSNAVLPVLLYKDVPVMTLEETEQDPAVDKDGKKVPTDIIDQSRGIMYQFNDLARRYPEQFEKYYGEPTKENCADALRLGRQVYIGEGCWHCHSQFVRPVANESLRWGPVSESWEYQNDLQRPVMFGTRRIGPDLCREGGRRSNDWQAVHLFNPKLLSTGSPMPEYPWFFDGAPDKPNKRGIALLTYIQWLGSWLPSYPYYEQLKQDELE